MPSATTSKPTTPAGERKSLKTCGACGKRGESLCSPTSTTKGAACRLAARATMCVPAGAMTPPLASTAWAVMMTLLTRAIMAKTAASGMRVVVMLLCASCLAARCPSNSGALSATTTWKIRFFAAACRNLRVAEDQFMVRMTSLAWMYSRPCITIWLSIRSSSSMSSFTVSMTAGLRGHCGTLDCFLCSVACFEDEEPLSAGASSPW
mmetsp:Transcript_39749/g.112801  ORF Transcript_39749/g.112801 Transcript_39749/m.112801 type:complete len:207 (-) Transcript_39749:760-1380(-)